jgi:hypothetical protein
MLSDSQPGHYKPGERAAVTHVIGDWVDPTAGLDAVEKIIPLAGNRTPVIQPVAPHYTD